jgi:hypothetical protein
MATAGRPVAAVKPAWLSARRHHSLWACSPRCRAQFTSQMAHHAQKPGSCMEGPRCCTSILLALLARPPRRPSKTGPPSTQKACTGHLLQQHACHAHSIIFVQSNASYSALNSLAHRICSSCDSTRALRCISVSGRSSRPENLGWGSMSERKQRSD